MADSLNIFGIENSHLFQSTLLQAFETTYLIENSNSPDTVVGRCNLLESLFGMLLKFRDSPRYNIELQEALDNYKQIYYDKIISEKQISIITNADFKYLLDYFFDNIIRSFFAYMDKQFNEIASLKKNDARQKRISLMHNLLLSQNREVLKLIPFKLDKETQDKAFIKAEKLQKNIYNYINLKQDGFNEWVLVEVGGKDYEDENEAPISDVAKKMVKEIKSKLYVLQFELRNQDYRIRLKVTGINNVGLAIDEQADKVLVQKIMSLFK